MVSTSSSPYTSSLSRLSSLQPLKSSQPQKKTHSKHQIKIKAPQFPIASEVGTVVSQVFSFAKIVTVASKILKFIGLVGGPDLSIIKTPLKTIKQVVGVGKFIYKTDEFLNPNEKQKAFWTNPETSKLNIIQKIVSYVASLFKTVDFALSITEMADVAKEAIARIPVFGVVSKLPLGIAIKIIQLVSNVLGLIIDILDLFAINKKKSKNAESQVKWDKRCLEIADILERARQTASLERLQLRAHEIIEQGTLIQQKEPTTPLANQIAEKMSEHKVSEVPRHAREEPLDDEIAPNQQVARVESLNPRNNEQEEVEPPKDSVVAGSDILEDSAAFQESFVAYQDINNLPKAPPLHIYTVRVPPIQFDPGAQFKGGVLGEGKKGKTPSELDFPVKDSLQGWNQETEDYIDLITKPKVASTKNTVKLKYTEKRQKDDLSVLVDQFLKTDALKVLLKEPKTKKNDVAILAAEDLFQEDPIEHATKEEGVENFTQQNPIPEEPVLIAPEPLENKQPEEIQLDQDLNTALKESEDPKYAAPKIIDPEEHLNDQLGQVIAEEIVEQEERLNALKVLTNKSIQRITDHYNLKIINAKKQLELLKNDPTDSKKIKTLNFKIIKWKNLVDGIESNDVQWISEIQDKWTEKAQSKPLEQTVLNNTRTKKILSVVYRILKIILGVASIALLFSGVGSIAGLATLLALGALTYGYGIAKYIWKQYTITQFKKMLPS